MTAVAGRRARTTLHTPSCQTNCSSTLEGVSGAVRMPAIRDRYFWRLLSPRRHDLEIEQNRRPKTTRLRAGPRVLSALKNVDVYWPTAVRVFNVSWVLACDIVPPKASST